jgi:hypothetical protein
VLKKFAKEAFYKFSITAKKQKKPRDPFFAPVDWNACLFEVRISWVIPRLHPGWSYSFYVFQNFEQTLQEGIFRK